VSGLQNCKIFFRESLLDDLSADATDQLIANDSGIKPSVVPDDDPYRTLDDLMVVVEALCPVWPERGVFVESGKMLLGFRHADRRKLPSCCAGSMPRMC
jgi:hypothetical protein